MFSTSFNWYGWPAVFCIALISLLLVPVEAKESDRFFDPVFSDRFDSCALDAWGFATNLSSANVGPQGPSNRRYSGQCGLRVPVDSSTFRGIFDTEPLDEPSLIVRFYANFDGYDGNELLLLEAAPNSRFSVRYNYPSPNDLTLIVRDGSSNTHSATFSDIGSGWHSIEVVWDSGSSAVVRFSVNGLADRTLPVSNAGHRVDMVGIGNLFPSIAGNGFVDIDAYEARRISRPGRLLRGDADGDGVLTQADIETVLEEINGVAFADGQPDCNEDGVIGWADIACLEDLIDIESGQLQVAPQSISFGVVEPGTSWSMNLTVSNSSDTGSADLLLEGIGLSGDAAFAFGDSECTISSALSPGESCGVEVQFEPTTSGAFNGEVQVETTDGQTATVTLLGEAESQSHRVIQLSGNLSFGEVEVGDSATRTLTISNTGSYALSVSGITSPTGFSGNWSGSVSPGGSQPVSIAFQPESETNYGGILSVQSNATDGQHEINISGAGILGSGPGDPPIHTNQLFQDRFERLGYTEIVFGNVELRTPEGQTKASTQTDVDGRFPAFDPDQIEPGDAIVVYGGFWQGVPFAGEFRLLLADPQAPQVVTPITTLIDAVAAKGFITGATPAERLTATVALLRALWMIDDDWNRPVPSRVSPLFHAIRAGGGIQNWVSDLVAQIEAGVVSPSLMSEFPYLHGGAFSVQAPAGAGYWLPGDVGEFRLIVETGLDAAPDWLWALESGPDWLTVDGTGQLNFTVPESASPDVVRIEVQVTNADSGLFRRFELEFEIIEGYVVAEASIGPEGGSVWSPDDSLGIEVSAGALTEVAVIQLVEFMTGSGSRRTRFRTIPVDAEFDEPVVVHFGTAPDIALFDSNGTQERGDESSCMEPGDLLESDWGMRMCIEDYFVGTRVGLRWAVAENRLPSGTTPWTLPEEDNNRFERSLDIASVLTARCQSCEDRIPVIFIHGYTGSGVGGGQGTWLDFRELLHAYGGGDIFAVYEFRYRSNARFEEIAHDLGMAIEVVANETNQKVNLVAHSFGGLVARTYLQGLAANSPGLSGPFESCEDSRHPHVESLFTLGSPHSGIANQVENLHGAWLPRGVHGAVGNQIDAVCSQMTCWQAGARGDVFNMSSHVPMFSGLYGVEEQPGSLVAQLHDFAANPLSVPVRSILGLLKATGNRYADGDGLISYQGQRFSPLQSCSGSQCTNHAISAVMQTTISGQGLGHCLQERLLGGGGGTQPVPLDTVPTIGKLERIYRHSRAIVHHAALPAEPAVNADDHLPWLNPDGSGSWVSTHDAFNQLLAWLDPGPPERNIDLIIDGQGSVQIDSGGEQFQCSSSCFVSVPADTATLTANPSSGASFDQFVGCTSVSGNQCTLAVGPQTGLIARFVGGDQTELRVNVTGEGSVAVEPGGQECTGGTCIFSFTSKSKVTLTADFDGFREWSGACSGIRFECEIDLEVPGIAISVTANFGDRMAWSSITTQSAPSRRLGHAAFWTGQDMLIWGAGNGAVWNKLTNSWRHMSSDGQPSSGRAVWTGDQLLVFDTSGDEPALVGYDPVADQWASVSSQGVPEGGVAAAFWTGDKALFLISSSGSVQAAFFDPELESWQLGSPVDAQIPSGSTATWLAARSEVLIWGGQIGAAPGGNRNQGIIYSLSADSWRETSTVGAPSPRRDHTAVWTGEEVLIWGGVDLASTSKASGGAYDPATDSWRSLSTSGAPSRRDRHTAIWTGREMIVWGGGFSRNTPYDYYTLVSGAIYRPDMDSWISSTPAVSGTRSRDRHSAVWTGSAMLVWGGYHVRPPGGWIMQRLNDGLVLSIR